MGGTLQLDLICISKRVQLVQPKEAQGASTELNNRKERATAANGHSVKMPADKKVCH